MLMFVIKIACCQQHVESAKYAHGISGMDWFGFGALQHGRNSTSISLCRCKIHQPRFWWRVQRAPHAHILMLLLSLLLWWSGKCPIFGRRVRFLCSRGLHARALAREREMWKINLAVKNDAGGWRGAIMLDFWCSPLVSTPEPVSSRITNYIRL